MAPVTVEGIDKLIVQLDAAYKRVADAKGSAVKLPSAELNLLSILGQLRDAFSWSLRSSSREMLAELFGGSCTRVAHVEALIERLELSPMNASDQRLRMCKNTCNSVKDVLVDMGLAEALHEAEEKEKEAITASSSSPAVEAEPAEAPAAAAGDKPPEEAPPLPAPDEEPVVADEMAADIDVRPAVGAVVEEEWAELMGVVTCKTGCGRRTAPGLTRSGKAFDSCCRGCVKGSAHHKFCGLIDPKMVGEGRCINGCGRLAAIGTDKYGRAFDTCCRGCGLGEAHDEKCKPPAAFICPKVERRDEWTFFTDVKGRLKVDVFDKFLENCRLLTTKIQTFEDTKVKVHALFGKEHEPLCGDFDHLVGERVKVLKLA